MTRTQNSFFNFITSSFSTMLVVVLNFITRSVFVRYLGESYLGIEGYFTNILSMLSLTELGFGSAIVFQLYKPLETGDKHRIQVLMKLYRDAYRIIGCVIAALGLLLIPFLPRLIRDYDSLLALDLNPAGVFLLYLFSTVSSYWFFAYKGSLVSAAQKSYLITVGGYVITVVGCIAQILVLTFTHSFIWYLIVLVAQSICRSLLSAVICDRRFPYLKEKVSDRVSRTELRGFFKDCSALLLYNICDTVIGGTDSIILTGLVGLYAQGLYYAYTIIRYNLRSLLYTFLRAIQASLGSLYSTGNLDWSRLIFKVVHFATALLYGIGGVGLAVLTDDFITLWIGEQWTVTSWTVNGVTVATPVAFLIGLETFVTGLCYCGGSFRYAMGLFRELKYRPVASMLVNMGVCLWLVPRIGIAGCVISTIVSEVTTNLIFDPIVIHRCALKISPKGYFVRNILYTAVTAAAWLLSSWLCGVIPLGGIAGFVLRGFLCVGVTGGLFVLCFFRTQEFRFLVKTALSLLPRHAGAAAPDDGQGE